MADNVARGLEIFFSRIVLTENKRQFAFKSQVRINNKELGIIMPELYLHIADKTVLCKKIFEWTIEEAISAMKKLTSRGVELDFLAIYVGKKVFEDEKLVEDFILKVEQSGLLLENFAFEIYPECVFDESSTSFKNITRLKEKGVKFILLQFASENFPVSKITYMPVDILCLDHDILEYINGSEPEREYAKSITTMAKSLGKTLIAYDIKKQEAYESVIEYVDLCCGLYVGKPIKERYIRKN